MSGERKRVPEVPWVSEAAYLEAVEDYMGWCPACREFTRESTEPDAEGYDCPQCEGSAVVGAEQALLLGAIRVTE